MLDRALKSNDLDTILTNNNYLQLASCGRKQVLHITLNIEAFDSMISTLKELPIDKTTFCHLKAFIRSFKVSSKDTQSSETSGEKALYEKQ